MSAGQHEGNGCSHLSFPHNMLQCFEKCSKGLKSYLKEHDCVVVHVSYMKEHDCVVVHVLVLLGFVDIVTNKNTTTTVHCDAADVGSTGTLIHCQEHSIY